MTKNQFNSLFIDQTKDLIWAVDNNLYLVYANKAYLNLMKEITGVEKKLNTPILVEGFGEGYIEKWKAYYLRALSGEGFEIEEHFYNPETKEIQYGYITFSPIRDEVDEIQAVACRNTDISSLMKQKDHASSLMDASLDVFCTIEEAGNFVFVSAASAEHWGYHPEELIGTPFRDLIVEEDLEKSDLVAAEILAGKEFKYFSNRYRKKNGDIAYNLWSARWDKDSKLMYCVARDVKEKFEEEAEKELLSQISLSFNNEAEFIPAASRLCENLYAFGKFDLIELWCPNMERTRLKLMGRSSHSQDFYELEPSETSFQKNQGLQGKVWEKGKQLLWDEKQINKHFFRKKGASRMGLKAILGIPLTFSNELVGVLLIGTRREPDYLEQQSPVLNRLEKFVGPEINRKRLENDLRNVYDAIPEILCITDFEGRFLNINNAGCALLGYTRKEVLFHSLDEFSPKEDKGKFKQKIKDITKVVPVFTFENRFLTKDGQVIWLSWNCNPALEEGLVYASAKNITTEVQLRELNIQAGTLAKIGSWEVDLEKSTVFWSKMVHQLHETDPYSFTPDLETAINFYREDFRPLVQGSIEKSIATGKGFDFEAVIVTEKLKERWVRSIGNVETVNGKAIRIYGSFQDITDRKESELRLQTLSDDLPGVTFQYVIKPDGQDSMRLISKASGKIWGLSPKACEENNDKVWNQIKKGGDFNEVQQSIQHSITSGEKWHYRWRNVLPNGELRWHEGFGTPNLLPDGTVIFNSMIFDITEEKKAVLLYEETAETARLGTWELDLVSQKVYLSKVTREIHELDEKTEISLEDALNFYKESYRDVARQAIQNGIEKGEPWEFELPIITAKGNERWVRGIGQVEMIEGKAVRLFGSFQDIHERKIAELRLQSIANDLPGVVFQYQLYPDGTDRLLTVSKGSQHIWGLSPQLCEADINLVWDQIKKGGDYEQVVQDITHSIQTKTQWHSKWRNILPDGKVRWHKGFGTPYFQPDGTIIYNSMVFDYTDEKLAVDLYQQALADRATILESISDAFYAVDADWNFTYFNKEAENLLKKSADEVLGGNIWEIFSPAKGTILEEIYRRVASTGQSENFEYHYPGDGCWYDVTTYPSRGGVSSYFKNIDERRKAAQELEKAYHERNNILDSISDNFYALNSQFEFSYMNESCAKLLQIDQGDVLGKNLFEEFPELRGTEFEFQLLQSQRTKEATEFEFYYETYQSWFSERIYPTDEGYSIYFFDITDVKAAEKAILVANELLAQSNEEKSNILESIGDAFYAVDEDWTVTYWNKQAESVVGKKKEDVLGKNLWEEFPDAIDTDFYRQFHRAMETGNTINFEEHYATLDMWIEVAVYPSENGLSIYFKDISLRKVADIRLLKANERFELVTKATNDAIWDWDIENDHFFRSNNICKILGSSASKKLKKSQFWQDAFHPEDLENLKERIQSALNDPQSERWEMEYRVFNENNEELSVIDRGIIVRNRKGEATRMVGAMTDLTKQKKLEKELFQLNESLKNHAKELERSNEELEQFAFITSHDLQEPLRMISGFMQQLKLKYADQLDEKGLQYIHYAIDGAKRMKQIILDLLLYSRANRPTELLEEVNLNEVVSEYTQLRRKLIAEKNAVITFDALSVLEIYRAPVTQVIHCLLDNALKYVKENVPPCVEIHTKEKETVWEFSVKDNGIGIDEKFHDKIFIIFQRLHNRKQHDGTGIGLSIAKRSVEFMGGEIWLESKVGEGTTFYFTIQKNN